MSGVVPVLGVLAGIVAVADVIPYIRDTIRRSTCPHRGTWLIWAVLSIVVCLSQRADGASWSLIMSGAQAVLTGLIFLLAIRLGTAGASRADALVIAIAGVGVAGWLIAEQPIVATGCVVVAADLIAAGLMVPKTWREPDSETLSTFAFASVGGALAVGSVGSAPMFRAAREIKVRATSQEAARRAGPTLHSYAPEWVDHYAGRGRISASADRLRACVLRGEVSGRGPTSR